MESNHSPQFALRANRSDEIATLSGFGYPDRFAAHN